MKTVIIDNETKGIDDHAFDATCKNLWVTRIIIDEGITDIGRFAFFNCHSLSSIEIPSSVTSIGERAFRGCPELTSIEVNTDNPKYHSNGNCLIETATKTLVLGCKTSVIPDDGSVTSIGAYAFYGCENLTSITLPDSVTSIGDAAFDNCSSLTSITIPDSVTSIGDFAFEGCEGLTMINLPCTIKNIGESAFPEIDIHIRTAADKTVTKAEEDT